MKSLIKKLLRESLSDYPSKWMEEKDQNNQKRVFIEDASSKLNTYFGEVNDLFKIKKIQSILGIIFNYKTSHNDEFEENNEELRDYKLQLGKYFKTNDIYTITVIIDNTFNGD